jgi:hypothetical protein
MMLWSQLIAAAAYRRLRPCSTLVVTRHPESLAEKELSDFSPL